MARLRLGVVADDVTGAHDIGSMFAKAGRLTHVYPYRGAGDFARHAHVRPAPEVVILDSNSRLDPPAVAYAKVHAATRELLAAGCRQYYKKTCSVFRGNIGAEFDAMLDVLGSDDAVTDALDTRDTDFAVVVLGFPKNGRTTVDGLHYVHGQRLEDSAFRNDPIHPMTRSNLVEMLQSQTKRSVSLVDHTVIRQGPDALHHHLAQLSVSYAILDVPDQEALRTIAAAVHDLRVFCGSSALAEELPAWWEAPDAEDFHVTVPPAAPGLGGLVAAGSLTPQTRAQLDYLQRAGAMLLPLDTVQLAWEEAAKSEIERVAQTATGAMRAGRDAVVHSAHAPEAIAATRQAGADQGHTATEMARRVSEALAEIVAQVLAATGQNRLVVAGGETSSAVCARLGIAAMQVLDELAPGLPSCLSLDEPRRLLVLKSGSFGGEAFLAEALAYTRTK